MIKRFSIIGVTLLVAFFYARYEYNSIQSKIEGVARPDGEKSDLVLKALPDTYFKTLKGEKFELQKESKASGKEFVVIHFWGTWCAPCEAEFPELLRFIDKASSKKVVFYLVAVNDEIPKIKKFIDQYKIIESLKVKLLIDNDGHYFERFGTAKVPETYVFNTNDFSAVQKFTGPQSWEDEYYLKFLNSL